MPKRLSESELKFFQREGYIPAFKVCEEEEISVMRRELETFESKNGGSLSGIRRLKNHLFFKWLSDFIRLPSILDPVEDIIGPDILVWSVDWWIKEARTPKFVSWHQDSQYWGLDSDKLVTAWVAFSPATIQSGCMRVLPGSHLGPDLKHTETFNSDNLLSRGQAIENIPEDKAINLEVATGHATIFSYRIAHASHPNQTDERRIGLAIRYVPPDARQQLAEKDSATLVRGEDRYGHFELEPTPRYDFDPVGVEFHKYAEKLRRDLLFKDAAISDPLSRL